MYRSGLDLIQLHFVKSCYLSVPEKILRSQVNATIVTAYFNISSRHSHQAEMTTGNMTFRTGMFNPTS